MEVNEQYALLCEEFDEPHIAEYVRKYGMDELANPMFIPETFDTLDQFYEYCLETDQMATDVATDIYE